MSVEIVEFSPDIILLYLSAALGHHNFAAAMLESELLTPLLDHHRHYRIYPFRLCTNCGSENYGYTHILSIPCCGMCVEDETSELPQSLVNCCDRLNFTIAKLSPPHYTKLIQLLR